MEYCIDDDVEFFFVEEIFKGLYEKGEDEIEVKVVDNVSKKDNDLSGWFR